MQVRSGLVRGGIAVLAASAAVLVAAPMASADNSAQDGAARGHVNPDAFVKAFTVNLGGRAQYDAVLFDLKLTDGSDLKMYCTELATGLRDDEDLAERPWNDYPNSDPKVTFKQNSAKINWVLHHGYPTSSLSAIEAALTKQGASLHEGLSKDEAISATQAAVWHFSDGKDLDQQKPLPYEDADASADVLALYNYLTGSANTGIGEQPKPVLNVSPAKAQGQTGTKIGPFTVSTSGAVTALTSSLPEGAKIVDADGNEVKAADVKDGTKLYVDVPKDAKDGNGTFALKASGDLATGRLFVGVNYQKEPTQTLIVAGSEKTDVAAQAAASWSAAAASPAPSTPAGSGSGGGGLAATGVNAAVPAGIGGLLLGAGALMLFLVRRRRSA